MGFIGSLLSKVNKVNSSILEAELDKRVKDINSTFEVASEDVPTEYCMNCYANLELQKGFSKDIPYWVCRGCGQMCINPDVPSDIVWICDGCKATLNLQEGFSENHKEWICSDCGFTNKIDPSEIYLSEEEFQIAYNNPYRGLSDEEILTLSCYEEIENIAGKPNIYLIEDIETKQKYVKKILKTYDKSVYDYLLNNPISQMPRLKYVFESANSLIVIEDYIEGRSLLDIINDETISIRRAVSIARDICQILSDLHTLEKPIIHRDIKPSNIIIDTDNQVYLLDINVAKWLKEDENEDTKLLGTKYYAAPEQLGYGFNSSTDRADIYALGVVLNVMITGKLPKEERASGPVWEIIERCVSLEPDNRYTSKELVEVLETTK